ncbi:hypothetical protein LCUFL03_80040 [Latilactobacillus curvatus]|nr:hypothetical protein LCUFL03_80040 [Latilactobacillus curvatus]
MVTGLIKLMVNQASAVNIEAQEKMILHNQKTVVITDK